MATDKSPMTTIGAAPPFKMQLVNGGAAGDLTVSNILLGDKLAAVVGFKMVLTEGTPNTAAFTDTDFTDEFTITADGKINNTGGSNTSGYVLFVCWFANPINA